MKEYIVFDVGGTEIKSCLLDEDGERQCEVLQVPSKAKGSKEEIMENFYWIIKSLAEKSDGQIYGMAFAFPGEFDYERGISLIKNLDKYDAIYEVNVKETIRKWICENEIRKQFQNPEQMPIIFVNDVEGFALGAAWNCRKAMAVVIGTGAGSAFIKNGKIAPRGKDGVPQNGAIYGEPFHGKRIDDWISKRGIMELSKRFTGKAMEGAELAGCVKNGDEKAAAAYLEFGRYLEEAVEPFLLKFQPDVCILGGQVMNSYSLFGDAIEKKCEELGIEIEVVTKTSETAFYGLYRALIVE